MSSKEIVVNIEESQSSKTEIEDEKERGDGKKRQGTSSVKEGGKHKETNPHPVKKEDKRTKAEVGLLKDLKTRVAVMENKPKEEGKQKVVQVPNFMMPRDKNLKRYYKPSQIAIGPVHSRIEQLANEDLKFTLAAEFIRASGKTGEFFLREIKTKIKELKELFEDKVIRHYDGYQLRRLKKLFKGKVTFFDGKKIQPNDDHQLAKVKKFFDGKVIDPRYKDYLWTKMLFLDGCTVLQFMHSFAKDELKKHKITKGQAAAVAKDLFLLDNQIPFELLKLLLRMNENERKCELVKSIYKFISKNVMAPDDYCSQRLDTNLDSIREDQELDLLVPQSKKPVHLLDLLRSELLFGGDGSFKSSRECKQTFRNVQELKATGIKLKPSKSCSMKAITFSTKWHITGQLKLPPLVVDNSTAVKFLNLVSYEMLCSDEEKSTFGVTSYLNFLDSLIDTEQDVKDLRAEHILLNRLGSDAEVAQLFNTMGSNLFSGKAYSDAKSPMQMYCERMCATWMAQFCQEYIRTPWTILALFGAIIALLLTGFGTWFTVYPRDG